MQNTLQQYLAPGSFHSHLVHLERKRSRTKKILTTSFVLTPLVDMFSLLVVFLLQAFSANPELMVVTKGVELPGATTATEIRDAPLISMSLDGVFLDQRRVGAVDRVLNNPQALLSQLRDLKSKWQQDHVGEPFRGEINFQAHKEISSVKVSQLMSLLPKENFTTIALTVTTGMGEGSNVSKQ